MDIIVSIFNKFYFDDYLGRKLKYKRIVGFKQNIC